MKKKKLFLILGTLTLGGALFANQLLKTNATNIWHKIGQGNLEAIEIDSKWKLHSVPATYINMLGVKGKSPSLLSKNVYNLNNPNLNENIPNAEASQEIQLDAGNNKKISVIKANGHVYNESFQPTQRTSDGKLVLGDTETSENIYLISDSGEVETLLDTTGYAAAKSSLKALTGSEEGLIWAVKPIITSDLNHIVFASNKDSINKSFFGSSIYEVSLIDKQVNLLIDATNYGEEIQLIGTAGNTLVGYLPEKDTTIIYNLITHDKKELKLDGHPRSLSPDGHSLLVTKTISDKIQNDLFIFDTNTLTQTRLFMPSGFFYNSMGNWSPDGNKFAFYMNGFNDNDPSKDYRTNVKIGIIDVNSHSITTFEKPSSSSYLYTLGSLSWLGNDQVVAYTDDDSSWALKIK